MPIIHYRIVRECSRLLELDLRVSLSGANRSGEGQLFNKFAGSAHGVLETVEPLYCPTYIYTQIVCTVGVPSPIKDLCVCLFQGRTDTRWWQTVPLKVKTLSLQQFCPFLWDKTKAAYQSKIGGHSIRDDIFFICLYCSSNWLKRTKCSDQSPSLLYIAMKCSLDWVA